jgi:hypothetical protein
MSHSSGSFSDDDDNNLKNEEQKLFDTLTGLQLRLGDAELDVFARELRVLSGQKNHKYERERETSLRRQKLFSGAMNELLLVLGKLDSRQLIEECEKVLFWDYPGQSTVSPERTGKFGESKYQID